MSQRSRPETFDLANLYIEQQENAYKALDVLDTALQHPHDHARLQPLRDEIA